MRRIHTASAAAIFSICWASSKRHVHERGFSELPSDPSQGEAYEAARDALLQINIMSRRGIEPDALMYTSLIQIMGRAGLEWQAYKLFSRMIESHVRPLPETYVALHDATSKNRHNLREQIKTKIEESVASLPEALANDELERMREEDRLCIAKYEEYLRGELPPPAPRSVPAAVSSSSSSATLPPAAAGEHGAATTTGSASSGQKKGLEADEGGARPTATMYIRNPTDAWNVAMMADRSSEDGGVNRLARDDDTRLELKDALAKLHEEELRIYLATQRQLRHGDKDALIQRVISTIGEEKIRSMLSRRRHYFRSVEKILAADMAQNKAHNSSSSTAQETTTHDHRGEEDRTLTSTEKALIAPEVLHAPWGILRKPMRVQPREETESSPRDKTERLDRLRLASPELALIGSKAATGDLDELPESLLRRYAFQHRLRWRRRTPGSLLDAVQWHAATFFPKGELLASSSGDDGGSTLMAPPPTQGIRFAAEKEGMQRTLENYEAFRVISQRTNNLQVVDDREINLHLKRMRREASQQEKKSDEAMRRERNIMAAAGLAASARSFTMPEVDAEEQSRVLGWSTSEDHTTQDQMPLLQDAAADDVDDASQLTAGGDKDDEMPDELPPWALFSGEDEFNITTGHFGDPTKGRYQELSDSRVRVLPSREAQKKWSVDRHLLPAGLKDSVDTAELDETQRVEAVEREYTRRLQYTKYRKWDTFLQSAQKKTALRREQELSEGAAVQPIPAKRRLSQILRKGRDKGPVSESMRERYNRSL